MDHLSRLTELSLDTPCYVFSKRKIQQNCENASQIIRPSGTVFLYSMKSLEVSHVLNVIKEYVDGFAVSSLFEAKLARDILGKSNGHVHLTTPGLKASDGSWRKRMASRS